MRHKPTTSEHLDRVVDECIAVRVRLINRVVTAVYDEALRPHGLRVSQANILVAVAHWGEARPAAVCRMLRIEKSTLSRDVELMKKKGWLEAEPPAGGRNQKIRVTPEGMRLLERTQPSWQKAQAEAKQLIGDDGVDALNRMAARLGLGKQAD
jgi:DNA-binding MarR family transcriptional regulator